MLNYTICGWKFRMNAIVTTIATPENESQDYVVQKHYLFIVF